MTNETALFFLRLAGSAALLLFLGVLFFTLWQDVRGASAQIEAARRSYGRLVLIEHTDSESTTSTKMYPLMPLTSIGRSPSNSIRIDDTFASAEHAIIALRNGTWWLEDRQSRNGTSLNELPVTEPLIITDGDIIGIGSLQFRIELEP